MIHLYKADWVLPVNSAPIAKGAVAVRRDFIDFVGAQDQIGSRFRSEEVIERDFGRAIILPGLVNVHSHLELTLLRGRLENMRFRDWLFNLMKIKYTGLRPEDHLVSARLGVIEGIRSGITTFGDTCDSGVAVAALTESGQRGVVYQEVFGVEPEIAEQNLRELQDKVSALKTSAGPLVRIGISPHAPYSVSPRLFPMLARYAQAENLPVAIHAAESAAEDHFVRSGTGEFAEAYQKRGVSWQATDMSVISYLAQTDILSTDPLLIHCVQVDAADIELLARTGCKIAHCPKSNAKFGHGVARLKAFLGEGIPVGIGTDSVLSNNSCDIIDETRVAGLFARALSQDGLSPSANQLIELATLGGAKALGLDHAIGTLETGKQADLCVVDINSSHAFPADDPEAALIFSSSASDVVCTVVAGRVLFDGGTVLSCDEADSRQAAQEVITRLFNSDESLP